MRGAILRSLQNSASVLILVAAAAATIATSKAGDYQPVALVTRDYRVATNCANAIAQEEIRVSSNAVTYPPSRDFKSYGMPLTEMDPSAGIAEIQGDFRGVIRRCLYNLYRETPSKIHLYTCYEANIQVCQTTFEEPAPSQKPK